MPTAHDEPAIHLEIYKEVFSAPAGIAYNTEVERRFLTTHFSIRAIEEETVGCGVDLPQAPARTRRTRRPDEPRRRRRTPDEDGARTTSVAERSGRTSRSAARCSAAATACTARSRSTAAASIPARAARS